MGRIKHKGWRQGCLIVCLTLLVMLIAATSEPARADGVYAKFIGNTNIVLTVDLGSYEKGILYRNDTQIYEFTAAGAYRFEDTGLTKGQQYKYELQQYWYDTQDERWMQVGWSYITTATAGEVKGTVDEDMTWDSSGGEWTVRSTVTVLNGATLTISPGTVVYGPTYGTAIEVQGTLNIEGAQLNETIISGYPSIVSIRNSALTSVSIYATYLVGFQNNTGSCYIETYGDVATLSVPGSLQYSNNTMSDCSVDITFKNNSPGMLVMENNQFAFLGVNRRSTTSTSSMTLKIRNNTFNAIRISHSNGQVVIENNNVDDIRLMEDNLGTVSWLIKSNQLTGKIILAPTSQAVVENNTITCPSPESTEFIGGIFPAGGIYLGEQAEGEEAGATITNNEIIGNTVRNCETGMYLSGYHYVTNNTIKNNIFEYNHTGISIGPYVPDGAVKDNLIYNNLFASAFYNAFFLPSEIGYDNNLVTQMTNAWNVSKTPGTNIVGGSFIGGNYWSDQWLTPDADGDGIVDIQYAVDHPYNYSCPDENDDSICDYGQYNYPGEYQIDNLPLVRPTVLLSAGSANPVNVAVRPAGVPVMVGQVKLKNIEDNESAVLIDSLTFTFHGQGDAGDVSAVRLYRDQACTGDSTTEIGLSFFSGTQVAFNGLSESINPGAESCYILKYSFDRFCPCSTYGAALGPGDVRATIDWFEEPVGGERITGYINASYPGMEIVGDDSPTGKRGEELPSPLTVKLASDIKPECYTQWESRYTIQSVPQGASGQRFEDGSSQIDVAFKAEGKAETRFTLGNKHGLYTVSAAPDPAADNPNQCPADVSIEALLYNILAGGVNLAAQFDGLADSDAVGTFITNIEAQNKLTAIPVIPPEKQVEKVVFDLNGEVKEDSTDPYEAVYDMAGLRSDSRLRLTAYLTDGNAIEDDYPFSAINFPSWLNYIPKLTSAFNWGFEADQKRYRVTFTYPANFIWSNPIPSEIPIIGGAEDEAGMSFSVNADYYIDQHTGFSASGEANTKIFSYPFKVKGKLEAQLDNQFKLKPGAKGSVEASAEFALPEKRLASKTILVYGVPVTLAVDLGGSVQVFVNGVLTLDHQFGISNMTFIPGTTITLDISASASAAMGLAKVGVKGSPSGTLKIKLKYTTAGGIVQEAFGGEIEVPITIFGSLFWDTVSGELGGTVLGPYAFGDKTGKGLPAAKSWQAGGGKRFYSTSNVTVSGTGQSLLVWTTDTSTSDTGINPEVAFKIDTGSGWSDAALITTNQLFELDPTATFLSGGRALALWTSNDGDKTLNNLKEILAHQDIAYSYFDGTAWSTEALVIDDIQPDGVPRVAYDASSSKALAVWVHNSNPQADFNDRSGWTIYYSFFDENTLTWSTPEPLPGTDNAAADYMPAVSSDGSGRFVVVWVKDGDGAYFTELQGTVNGSDVDSTNADSDLYYAVYQSGSWSAPASITAPDNYTEGMPDLAYTSYGDVALVWIKGQGTEDKLYLSLYRPSTNTWSPEQELDTGAYLIENPRITVDAENKAAIIFRKHDGNEDAIYSIKKDLSVSTKLAAVLPAEISRLTYDPTPGMWVSGAVTPGGELIVSWTGITETPISSAGFSDNIMAGRLPSVPTATLTGTYADQPMAGASGLYQSLQVSVGVNVAAPGSYSVAAALYDLEGNLISASRNQPQQLTAGGHTLNLSFRGSEIRAAGHDGPFVVRKIVLLDSSLASIGIDSDEQGFQTAAYAHADFIPAPLTVDKNFYVGESDTMTMRVVDEGATGSVTVAVKSSAAETPLLVTLNETAETGVFQGTVGFSTAGGGPGTLQVEDACALSVSYTDSEENLWTASAGWLSGCFKGDINGDSAYNILDLIRTLRISLGLDPAQGKLCSADMDANGIVNIIDAIEILHLLL